MTIIVKVFRLPNVDDIREWQQARAKKAAISSARTYETSAHRMF